MDESFRAEEPDVTEAEEFVTAGFEDDSEEFESSESEDLALAELEVEVVIAEVQIEDSVMVLEDVDVALVLPVWEPTGDAQVDAALEELATLDELSVHDHAEVLTSVHSSLHQRLTDISA
ncbi:MAG: hypothetical protein Q7L55_01945 [Actinomycetota bacterium]|nr:hypothetical protein [Actinomycetota bacterium]